MDASYKQSRIWMNNRGSNNTGSDNWGGFLPGPGPERSSLSLAGWSPYENTSRRSLIPNDIPPAPQRSAGTRWSHQQAEWNEVRGGVPPAGLNLWSGPSNGNPRVIQNQQQQPVQMQGDDADDFMQGFNNAGRDWFFRYMNMGCTLEEARDRVLERNRNYPESLDSGRRYTDAKERRNPADERYPDAKERRNPADERYAAAKEHGNPADERRRPTESNGSETLGNVLNSLNGACRKWYNKHLESGCTPEEALAKVLEHRRTFSASRPVQSSAENGGRKRPVVDSKVQDNPKKPKNGKEPSSQAETVSSEKNHLAVAIVAKNYPKYYLKKSEQIKIEDALLNEMRKGWTCSLNFRGIKYRPGTIVVTCLDEGSKEWLEQVVPKITAVQGVSLRIYKDDEGAPDSKAITFHVPRIYDESDDDTLRFVKEQNTDLLSGNWSLIRNAKQKNGKVMTLKIGDKSLELLNKRGMTISYRFSQLPCHIARGPLFTSSKKKKANDEPKKANDEPIANPPEIDLTAEDDEIELSEMTVLDEVQCDDDDENENENEGNEIAEEDANGNGENEQQCEEADEQ